MYSKIENEAASIALELCEAAKLKAGDIVVVSRNIENTASSNQKNQGPIIKRVIAVGGDTINIDFRRNEVYVNGVKLDEPYILEPTELSYDVQFPLTVDEGKLFVMGDNRYNSTDSRQVGTINIDSITGKVILRIYPFNKLGVVE